MWIPNPVLKLFQFNLDEQQKVRENLAVANAKVELLERQITHTQATMDWMRIRLNDLEYQNKALLEKAYNIQVPAPQVNRSFAPPVDIREFSFEDPGDEVAKKLGLT